MTPHREGTMATYPNECTLEKEGIPPGHFRQLDIGSELLQVARDLKHHPLPLSEWSLWIQVLN